jgi:uncharacterized protein (DUF2249 family)
LEAAVTIQGTAKRHVPVFPGRATTWSSRGNGRADTAGTIVDLHEGRSVIRSGSAQARRTAADRLYDDHSILLWQFCAYASEAIDASHATMQMEPEVKSLLRFLRFGMLPYLCREEDMFSPERLHSDWVARALEADHVRIRADVDRIEACRSGTQVRLAIETLLTRLDRHMAHEQAWAKTSDPCLTTDDGEPPWWSLSLLLGDDIDVETLPPSYADTLVLTRLQQMRRGEALWLRAGHELHPLWRQLNALFPGCHGWVYERTGPLEWIVCVTRREAVEP